MAGSISATTIAGAGLALSAVGTGVSVMGQMQQASAAKASADYQSQVAAGNAQVATQNANMAAASGEAQAAISEQKTRATVGAEEAAQGSSGVDINSPTAKAVRTSQDMTGQLDAQTIRSNAARQAYGYETQSTNFQNQSSADTAQGNNAMTAGEFGSVSSGLSGVGNAGLNYAGVMNKASGISTSDQTAYALNNAGQGNTAYDVIQNSPGF